MSVICVDFAAARRDRYLAPMTGATHHRIASIGGSRWWIIGQADRSKTMSELAISLNVGDPVPANPAECADILGQVRALRFELQHKLEDIEKREKEIKEHIIATLQAAGIEGVSGKSTVVKVKPKRLPVLDDWAAFTAWVLKTGHTEVLYKRVSSKAVEEIEANGDEMPDGVGFKNSFDLSVTKAK